MANNTGKKYGGREEGTPNKLTKELRTVLKNILHQEIELIPNHFNKLDAKDRLELLAKLLPFAIPKVESDSYDIQTPVTPPIEWIKAKN
jgi:hypothetical protein